MTGPTSEGSVNKEFVNKHYVSEGKITAVIPNINEKGTKLKIERNGDIGIGEGITLNEGPAIPTTEEEIKYYIETRRKCIETNKRLIEESKEITEEDRERLLNDNKRMTAELNKARKELQRLDEMSK